MSTIFAGISATGEIRFIGDVPSGLACECFCSSCSSPLEAKKGMIRTWHFAHIASQERPECLAGALNLLRRLAVLTLSTFDHISIPGHLEHVTDTRQPLYGRKKVSKVIEAQLTIASGTVITWADSSHPKNLPPRTHPIGVAALANGAQLEIFVDVHIGAVDTSLRYEAVGDPNAFKLVYCFPPPTQGEITSHESATAYLRRAMRSIWIHFPDRDRRRSAALAEVNALADETNRRLEAEEAKRQRHRQAMFGSTADEDAFAQLRGFALNPTSEATKPVQCWSWAPDARPHTSFFLFPLKGGGAWMVYQTTLGSARVLPWPNRWEGWDEFFPPSVAALEPDRKSLIAKDIATVTAFIGCLRDGTYNDSDPTKLPGFPPDL